MLTDAPTHTQHLPNRETFADWVHDALSHLYDSDHLASHPLTTALVGKDNSAALNRSQALRRALLEAVGDLRPDKEIPPRSRDWRFYRILKLRYIEGRTTQQAMDEIGVARSQFFRDQSSALDVLTNSLWMALQDQSHGQSKDDASVGQDRAGQRADLFEQETERLYSQARWEQVDLKEVLNGIHNTLTPLAQTRGASLHICLSSDSAILRSDRVMLRQTILNTITLALDTAQGGHVAISDYERDEALGIRIVGWPAHVGRTNPQTVERQDQDLAFCRRLTEALGGRFKVSTDGASPWEAHLEWSVARPPTLLVVDNNADIAKLFHRYLAGSEWRVVGAASGAEARDALTHTYPSIIILDVMMPEEDGWELLAFLKEAPIASDIPILICSVLNEPQLALDLGAQGYLQKPVTPQALREALAQYERPILHTGPEQ